MRKYCSFSKKLRIGYWKLAKKEQFYTWRHIILLFVSYGVDITFPHFHDEIIRLEHNNKLSFNNHLLKNTKWITSYTLSTKRE
jgi:hypothetical protein